MASAAITVTNQPATIESDTDEAIITLSNISRGTISNKSGATVFIGFDKSPITTKAQDKGTIFLDPGDSVAIPKGTKKLNHITLASTAVLFFNPSFGIA